MLSIKPSQLAALASLALVGATRFACAQTVSGKFDVGGRGIALTCHGTGNPTVVIDAGQGTAPVEDPAWSWIAGKIAAVTRVCLYDRAGLGSSDANPKPVITSADSVDDEVHALTGAGVQSPYVVVGHSLGGLDAQVFAARYPSKVAGLVLVSTTHPDQFMIWSSLLPAATVGESKVITDSRSYLKAIQAGPPQNSERLDSRASEEQARQLHSFGSKPVIVLTHSPKFRMVPGLNETLSVKLEGRHSADAKAISSAVHERNTAYCRHGWSPFAR